MSRSSSYSSSFSSLSSLSSWHFRFLELEGDFGVGVMVAALMPTVPFFVSARFFGGYVRFSESCARLFCGQF